MEQFIDYYYELTVKSCLTLPFDELEESIIFEGNKTYNLDFLDALEKIILDNENNLFLYQTIYNKICDFIKLMRQNVIYLDPVHKNIWLQKLFKIQTLLGKSQITDEYDFYRLEYIKRKGLESVDWFYKGSDKVEQAILLITHSIKFDDLMVQCLSTSKNSSFNINNNDLENEFVELDFLWSMNKFYKEKPELFNDLRVKKRVIKNLEMIANPGIRALNGDRRDYYLENSEDSKILLNKLR